MLYPSSHVIFSDILIEHKTKMLSGYESDYDSTWSHFGEMFNDYKEIDTLAIKLTLDNKSIFLTN